MESRKINIPKDYSEITLEQYQAIKSIPEDATEDYYADVVIKTLTSLDYKDFDRMVYASRMQLIDELVDSVQEKEQYPLVQKVGHLGFIPNLDKITLGEYVDLDNNFLDPMNWHKFIAVCYRPITETSSAQKDSYLIEPYKYDLEVAEAMKQMTMDVVMGAHLFFCRLGSELAKVILNSGEVEEVLNKRKSTSLKSGGGTALFTYSVMETLEQYPKRWQTTNSIKHLISSHTKATKTI